MPNVNNNPLVTKHVQGGGGVGYTGLPTTSLYIPGQMDMADQNLQNLFGTLNQISLRGRSGEGGKGGGSEKIEGNQDANPLIALNPYMGENVTSFKGGGRMHSPYGVPKYFLGGWIKKAFGAASDILGSVTDPLDDLINPVFDVAGNVVDPALEGVSNVASAAGQAVTDVSRGVIEGSLRGAKNLGETAIEGVQSFDDAFGNIISQPVDFLGDFVWGAVDALFGQDMEFNPYTAPDPKNLRSPKEADPKTGSPSGLQMKGQNVMSQIKKAADPSGLAEGDWVGDKPNPYVTPNVEEELAYANKGMKMPKYDEGGQTMFGPNYYHNKANRAITENKLAALLSNIHNSLQGWGKRHQEWKANRPPAGIFKNQTTIDENYVVPQPEAKPEEQASKAYSYTFGGRKGDTYQYRMLDDGKGNISYQYKSGPKGITDWKTATDTRAIDAIKSLWHDSTMFNKTSEVEGNFGTYPQAYKGMKMRKRYTNGGRI